MGGPTQPDVEKGQRLCPRMDACFHHLLPRASLRASPGWAPRILEVIQGALWLPATPHVSTGESGTETGCLEWTTPSVPQSDTCCYRLVPGWTNIEGLLEAEREAGPVLSSKARRRLGRAACQATPDHRALTRLPTRSWGLSPGLFPAESQTLFLICWAHELCPMHLVQVLAWSSFPSPFFLPTLP